MQRVQVLLRHFDYSAEQLFGSNTVAGKSPVSAVPSSNTIAGFTEKIKSIASEALAFSGVDLSKNLAFPVDVMNHTLDAHNHKDRKDFMNWIAKEPIFKRTHYVGLTLDEQREITFQMSKKIAHSGHYRYLDQFDNWMRYAAVTEALAYAGSNAGTKTGVHMSLFGGTIGKMGSKKHHDFFFDKIQTLEIRGCFALTELGHGSNVRGIETIATYDANTKEFILHTPHDRAQKYWIGNMAVHANWSVVFAQLFIGDKNHGVHAFAVQIRDDAGKVVPNIRIMDVGPKQGANGVDNGRMWLDKKRVPNWALLDKYASVSLDGVYSSPIKDPTERFATMIGALVGGRVLVAQGAINNAKLGLYIATKYALSRRQFGPPKKQEIVLMDYPSHQLSLIPLIAEAYVLQVASNFAKQKYGNFMMGKAQDESAEMAEVHILAAGLKPICTWFKNDALQICREACGGQGFHAANRIGVARLDSDIDTTWEGANVVLLQQVSASLMKEFKAQFSGGKQFSGMLKYMREQMGMELRDKNPVNRLRSNESHLLNYTFYRHALEYREARLLRDLVNRLRKTSNMGVFEAWNDATEEVQELAKAHVDRQLIEKFETFLETADTRVRPMLSILGSLVALKRIDQHMGWYMRQYYFSAKKAQAVHDEIGRLCRALRPHVGALVDSFGLSEELVDTPISKGMEGLIAANAYGKTPGELH